MKKIFILIIFAITIFTSCENNNNIIQVTEITTKISTAENQTTKTQVEEVGEDLELLSKALWDSDNSDLKSEQDCYIYSEIVRIFDEITDESMNIYQKELAIHDYLTDKISYHPDALDERKKYPEMAKTVYSTLKNRKAVCTGYANTFKLFMDYMNIENLIVTGDANGEHAWNLVKIDGDWYAVDVTWNDPIGCDPYHIFFNCNDKVLEKHSHIWDKKNYPTATKNFDFSILDE